MRKNIFASVMLAMFAVSMYGQEVTKLPAPDMNINVTLTDALQNRRSERDFNPDKTISDMQLSQLLWAACGINRTDKVLLTIPTATNAKDIQVYVCQANGVSLYDAQANTLTKVSDSDIRELLADRQQGVKTAPLFLLIVSDQTKFRRNAEHWGAMDAGYASQNICLMCAALGLKTVPRGIMNQAEVAKVLNLPETTVLELNHPIGY